MSVAPDRPIQRPEEDRLGRTRLAGALAEQVVGAPRGVGFVVGLGGRWGSGKTSLLNLVVAEARRRDPELITLAFNPWLFTGADELVLRFCTELAAQLRSQADVKVRSIGDRLADYGNALSPLGKLPFVGKGVATAELALAVAQASGRLPDRSAMGRHEQLRDALAELDRRVLVTVDDIDRLTASEVRELVRAVKIVGDLPNVVYILAYDRERTEAALGDDGDRAHGRQFLEKVVQVTHDVPPASPLALRQMIEEGLDASLSAAARFDRERWSAIYGGVLEPYVRTVRDVRRLLNALPVTFALLENELAAEDVVALEALRIFEHAFWEGLPAAAPALTELADASGLGDEAAQRSAIDELVQATGPNQRTADRVLELLFPVGASNRAPRDDWDWSRDPLQGLTPEWRRGARVALAENLRVYLDRVLPDSRVPALTVDAVYAALNAGRPIDELVRTLSSAQIHDLLGALADRSDGLDPEYAASAAVSLMSLSPRFGPRLGHPMYLGTDLELAVVVGSWLKKVEDDSHRESVLRAVFHNVGLSAKVHIIEAFCDSAVALVDWLVTQDLRTRLAVAVTQASAAELAGERRLEDLVNVLLQQPDGQTRLRELSRDDGFLVALLGSRLGDDGTLPWQHLTTLVDDLPRRALALANGLPGDGGDATSVALRLAARYATGERLPDPSA